MGSGDAHFERAEAEDPGDYLKQLEEELCRVNLAHTAVMACQAGLNPPLRAIESVVTEHELAFPTHVEWTQASTCLAAVATDGAVDLSFLVDVPEAWRTSDRVNTPILARLSESLGDGSSSDSTPERFETAVLARQILLEVICVRRESADD